MPRARKAQVALDATPYYHCISRCVRRAFLCGHDAITGQDFSHRRAWIEARILELAEVFALDLCAYAVMSNHVHLVLHINADKAMAWSSDEVIERWHRLFKGSVFSQRHQCGDRLSIAEQALLNAEVAKWRARLQDISWYMRCLNETIARRANKEDNCTGRFWEGRFKTQALLDEKALAACLAYVDLNPLRAAVAATPEKSQYTSVRRRIQQLRSPSATQPAVLFPFAGYPRDPVPAGLPFRLEDYLDLLDWTGRQLGGDKRGAIANHIPPILERLAIEPHHWLSMTQQFESRFSGFVGMAASLKRACQSLGYRRTIGLGRCRPLFG